ncbi:MAG: hypothetical protein IPJ74_21070 [Saprospiraceae bacterium]|nr:hypothetical protein [Saprospiraceae bacterium]
MVNKNNISSFVLYTAIAFGLVGLIVLYVMEFKYFNRTFQANIMTLWSIVIGIIIGILLSRRFIKSADDFVDRIRIVLLCTVGIAIFMPLFTSLSNRLFSFYDIKMIPVEFVESEAYVGSRFGVLNNEKVEPTGYRTFIYRDTKLLKILTEEALFPDAQRGDSVQLSVKKGFWGFEFVPK